MGKKKKALFVATVYGFLNCFETTNMRTLQELGYEVHCIGNPYVDQDIHNPKIPTPKLDLLNGIIRHEWICKRSPYKRDNIIALQQLNRLLEEEEFDLVHCHTPMGGVLARIACDKYRKKGMKVIYSAHGFHFYRGAPVKNWILYYEMEKFLSRKSDAIITINHEDYLLAKKRFHARKVFYVPGVGVDINNFRSDIDIDPKRAELGLSKNDIMLLSVGELDRDKNHTIVLDALAEIYRKNPDSHIEYFIAGPGKLGNVLQKKAEKLGIEQHFHILGRRKDISELDKAADLFVFPSLFEGLSVALMEAIASKTPILCTNVRGNSDLARDDKNLFELNVKPEDSRSLTSKLELATSKGREGIKEFFSESIESNYENLKKYDRENVKKKVRQIYCEVGNV